MIMRKFTIFTILLCISLMSSIPGFAQSSSASGTTISFKYGTATPLYSSGAGKKKPTKPVNILAFFATTSRISSSFHALILH